ncbi:MAG: hypothetical protein BGO12_20265 [Verrucomicrobia bacterium 61-8]|nr:MAG: hypothetical protein BGO12_20265 [Verrucomicrobia bacterium 61-8]
MIAEVGSFSEGGFFYGMIALFHFGDSGVVASSAIHGGGLWYGGMVASSSKLSDFTKLEV